MEASEADKLTEAEVLGQVCYRIYYYVETPYNYCFVSYRK